MIPDLTREELEQLFGDFGRGRDLGYGDQRLLLAHALSEPARLAAARAEGVREGIEIAAGHLEEKAAGFFADRDAHMRAWEASKSSRAEEVHQRRACSAEVVASSLLGWAAKLRALAPAPAEAPTTPTVEASGEWIEWKGGECPVTPGSTVRYWMANGRNLTSAAGRLNWNLPDGDPRRITYYCIVQPDEASAPVAEESEEDVAYRIGLDGGEASAIQRIDLQTGGEGEYRGSTIPGRTVDVAVMEKGIVDRFAALEAENEKLRGIVEELDDALGEDEDGDEYPDDTPMTLKYGRTTYYSLSLGLLRRARALLQGQEVTP